MYLQRKRLLNLKRNYLSFSDENSSTFQSDAKIAPLNGSRGGAISSPLFSQSHYRSFCFMTICYTYYKGNSSLTLKGTLGSFFRRKQLHLSKQRQNSAFLQYKCLVTLMVAIKSSYKIFNPYSTEDFGKNL